MVPNRGQKFGFMPDLVRFPRQGPAHTAQATNEHGQLCVKLRSLLRGEAVAQRMQGGTQAQIRLVPVRPSQFLHDVLEPDVRLLYRHIKHVQSCHTHTSLLLHILPMSASLRYPGLVISSPTKEGQDLCLLRSSVPGRRGARETSTVSDLGIRG